MISSSLRWVSCIFLLCCASAFAQQDESLIVIEGDFGPPLAGQQHRSVVNLASGDEAVRGERLYLSTNFGELAASQVITDAKGFASIIISAGSAGAGEVTVRTKLGTTLRYPIEFDEPTDNQLLLTAPFKFVYSPDETTINVRLIDENLDPVAGETISLSVGNPSHGVLDDTTVDTNSDGEASTNFAVSDGLPADTKITFKGEVASTTEIKDELLVLVANNGADQLQIIQPGNQTRVEPGAAQSVEAIWRRGSTPVANQTISFSTTHGILSNISATTDSSGIARTSIQAAESGIAVLTASIDGATSDPVIITFAEVDSTNDRYHTGGTHIPLQVLNDRIGIQARTGVTGTEVLEIANKENFIIRRTLKSQLFEFELESAVSRATLQALARRLEGEYGDRVRTAGLVVQRVGGTRPVLMSNKIRAGFIDTPGDAAIELLKEDFPIDDVRLAPNSSRYYEIILSDDAAWNIFAIAEELRLQVVAPAKLAYPKFTMAVQPRSACVSTTMDLDPRYADQWHHDNQGNGVATQDADMDSVEAWNFTTGNKTNPLVAVIDTSFSINHCEFSDDAAGKDNLWSGVDAAGNPVRGWVYEPDTYADTQLLDPPLYSRHGTAVGGILASIAGNHWGGRGVCYDCKLLFMRRQTPIDAAAAFEFAIDNNVRIINNSWALDTDIPEPTLNQAIKEATDAGIVVLFAASNEYEDECVSPDELDSGDVTELSSFPYVIAVSASTDEDLRYDSGIGNCINVLGPTLGGENGVTTTGIDPASNGYYNTLIADFGGTSAATPMVAGIAGLILDIDSSLSQDRIRRILQDTADKINPGTANYDVESGYSTLINNDPNYAYGRVNAYEAVSLVAPYDPSETELKKRGKGGKDLVLRDHEYDWGNTEQPSNILFNYPREKTDSWPGTDLRLDAEPFQNVSQGLAGFLELDSEAPQIGKRTRVYVRVRNRGPYEVQQAILKVHWTLQSNPLPSLATDFWSTFPQDSILPSKKWQSAGIVSLADIEYSGASAAGCPGRDAPWCLPLSSPVVDQAQIAVLTIPALDWDSASNEQLALFVTVHSEEDPVLAKTGVVTTNDLFDVVVAANMDNNVTVWQSQSTGCGGSTITIIIVIILLVIILLAIIVIRGFRQIRIYVTLLVLLMILIIIVIEVPGCAIAVLETLGISMNF